MLSGDIRNQVDQIWNAFWSDGVSSPLSVIEQITHLLFIKRLYARPFIDLDDQGLGGLSPQADVVQIGNVLNDVKLKVAA